MAKKAVCLVCYLSEKKASPSSPAVGGPWLEEELWRKPTNQAFEQGSLPNPFYLEVIISRVCSTLTGISLCHLSYYGAHRQRAVL